MGYDILGNFVSDDSDQASTPIQNQKTDTQTNIANSAQPSGPVAPQTTATPNAWDDNSPLPNMPQGPAAPNPATPPDAVNFGVKDASTWNDTSAGPVAPAPGTVAAKAPPQPDYNTYTAQNESGNNPNIGYHDLSKGTAYGTYGLTAAAYKDIQAVDPAFKDRPITSLTPDEQAKANTDYKDILAKQLQAQGLDPSEANIRLAHFMGAKGAADYLKTGAVSPQAAAANGGVDNVQKIAQARLAGTPGAASGATNAPPTHAEQFVQATQNPKDLAALRNDENAPAGIRQAAADQDYENLKMQRDAAQAKQRLDQTMNSGNWLGLAKELNKQSDEGSIFKAMFYQKAGLADLAKQEQQKLGAGRTWQTVDLGNGRQGVAQIGADGAPIKGYTDSGPMAPEELASAVGVSGAQNKTAQTQAQQAAANLGETLRNKAAAAGFQYPAGYIEGEMKKAYNTTYQTLIHPNGSIASLQSPSQMAESAPPPAALQPQQAPTQGQQAPQGPAVPGQPTPAPQVPQQAIVQPSAAATPNTSSVLTRINAMGEQQPNDTPDTFKKRREELAKINPADVDDIGHQLADGNIRPQDISGRSTMFKNLAMERAAEVAKEQGRVFNSSTSKLMYDTRKGYTDPSKGAGAQMQAINRAIPHLDQYKKATEALNNGDFKTVNHILNEYGYNVGDDKVAGAKAIRNLISTEVQKAVTGGLGGVEERSDLADKLSEDLSPKQMAQVIDQYQGLMYVQADALKHNWTSNGLPEKEWEDKLVPRAREVYNQHKVRETGQGKTKNNISFKVISQ